jgi:nucleoside-diphosphate-sugar epimerase
MPTAFVTGATGFIGGHLAAALVARGWRVKALVRPTSRTTTIAATGAELFTAALDDAQALAPHLENVDCVFHVAGAIAALNEAEFQRVNAAGAAALAAACAAQSRPPTFIYVSSVAAAGPIARGRVRAESDAASPISAYGRSKFAAEQALRDFAGDLPITVVRPGVVFGPGDRSTLSIFSGIAYSGLHVYPRFRTPPLSVIYVDDLVEILLAAADQGERLAPASANGDALPGQGVYFATRDEFPTYHEFGWLAAQALGRRWFVPLPLAPPIPFLVGGLSQLAGQVRGKASIVNLDKMREATVTSWACSPAKVQQKFRLVPRDSLLEQMRQTVVWYRTNRWI